MNDIAKQIKPIISIEPSKYNPIKFSRCVGLVEMKFFVFKFYLESPKEDLDKIEQSGFEKA